MLSRFDARRVLSLVVLGTLVINLYAVMSTIEPVWAPTGWWNASWQYRCPINLTSTQSLTNYTVMITVDTESLIPSKMQISGSDIRFVDSLGTEIPYWIETPTINTTTTRIWTKVSSLAIGNTTIWMYYGNPTASPTSDGAATFEFFDDDWSQFAANETVGNPVHTAGQSWWEATVSYPMVFEDDSFPDRPRFHMLYDGHNVIGHAKGYAWSSDLNNWVEYDGGTPHPPNPNPILGVGYTGDSTCAWGDVMKADGTYYMYYSNGPGTIYYAESTNLTHWSNLQPTTGVTSGTGTGILKEGNGITPIAIDGKYWMVYFPGGSPGSMNLASTNATGDLLSWDLYAGNPILSPTLGGWDQDGLWTPSFTRLNDKYYLYYQGNGPAGWETGFASADAYDGGGAPISPDMAVWSKSDPDEDGDPDPVIRNGAAGSWDSTYCIDPMIREFNGTYYVFYTGDSANGYAYSDSPEGPWTKYGEDGGDPPGPVVWTVTGTPTVADGILTLPTSGTSITSLSTHLYQAIGFRANFVSGAKLSWGGFIAGSVDDRTMIGTERTDSNLYLKNYVSAVLNSELSGSWVGDFHVYEILWQNGNSTGVVDHGAATTSLTSQVPSIVLPVTFYNYDDSNPIHVDWVFVRQYSDPEPLAYVGEEEARPAGPNTPPVVSDLTITPSSPSPTDDLIGSYTYFDADGDPENGTEIRWYKDAVLQPDYNNTLTISASSTALGEEWHFTIRPSDGEDFGTLQTSPSVTIMEAAPEIRTFGKTSQGGSQWNLYSWYAKVACRFEATEEGEIYAITAYTQARASGMQFRAVIYSDTAGTPDALLAYGDVTELSETAGWQSAPVLLPITGSTYYWIGIQYAGRGGCNFWYDPGASGQTAENSEFGIPDDPFGTADYMDYELSIYANYTAGAPPPPPVDTTPPTYSDVGANATDAGQLCLFYARWSDDVELSGYIFSNNNTGTWLNSTWTPLSGVSDWSNVTRILNPTVGATVQYQFHCNDTSNNWNSTPIQALTVTEPVIWYASDLSLFTTSAPALVGYQVDIVGNLAYEYDGSGIPDAFIQLHYRVMGDEDWNTIAATTTGFDGDYKATWFTMATGNIIVRAVYVGDEELHTLGDETPLNLIIADIEEQAFSISSNSTVSDLIFNSTAREIRLTVSGPSGTQGYLNIFLSKTLVSDVSDLRIYLDEAEIDHEAVSLDDLWFIHLTYGHSIHTVRMILSSPAGYDFTDASIATAMTAMIAVAAAAALLILFRKKRRP